MFRPFLALRYLLTRPIHLLGMLGVAVGVWAMIVVVSIFSGFLEVVGEHLRAAGADLTVLCLSESVNGEALVRAVEGDPNVTAAAPRVTHFGLLLRPGERPAPLPLLGRGSLQGGDGPFLFVLGVDPLRERPVTGLRDWLLAVEPELRVADPDRPLQPIDGLPAILLGRDRMLASGLKPGDRVVLTTGKLDQAALSNGPALEQLHRDLVVAGAYRTEHVGFDGNNTFVHIDTARDIVLPDRPEAVQEVVVRLTDPALLEQTALRLDRQLPRELGRRFVVQTWQERNRSILQGVDHQRGLMKIVLIITMVVAAALMFATLSMMVAEKTPDIGILTALGGTPMGVMQVFLSCGLAITLAGLLLGVLVGCLSAIYLDAFNNFMRAWFDIDLFPTKVYNLQRVPHHLDPVWIAQVCGMALLVGGVVSAIPALRAARHDPLVSLRGT